MLDKILEYQSIDGELFSAENDLAKSSDRERALEIQQVMKNQHSRLLTLENNAKSANEAYLTASKKYSEFKAKLAELEKQLENANEENVAVYEKAYKDFVSISSSLEKEIATIYNQVQQIIKEYENIILKSKSDRQKLDKYIAAYSKLKAEKEPQIAQLKAKLNEKLKGVQNELMAIYKQKRESHLFPIFVQLNSNKCGGCRMEISASKLTDMAKNKYGLVECENCGRLNFKKWGEISPFFICKKLTSLVY